MRTTALIYARIRNVNDDPNHVISRLPASIPCGLISNADIRNLVEEFIKEIFNIEGVGKLLEDKAAREDAVSLAKNEEKLRLEKEALEENEKAAALIESELRESNILKSLKEAEKIEKIKEAEEIEKKRKQAMATLKKLPNQEM